MMTSLIKPKTEVIKAIMDATNESVVDEKTISPMMLQWQECRKSAKDSLLLFRMGDFYEAFYEDAVILSNELDLVLTKRQGIPMSGVPCHTIDSYIDRLISKGHRIAVAEQTEDPKQAKGLVKREVVKIITPGTIINSSLLAEKSNNYFVSITQIGTLFGFSAVDVTTGEFWVSEFDNEQDVINELHRHHPAELLTSEKFQSKHPSLIGEIRNSYHTLINILQDWKFDHQLTYNFLTSHFQVHTLDGFGLKGKVVAINAAGALLGYLKETLCQSVHSIQQISYYSTAQYLVLDSMSQRNLELTESLQEGSRRHTLLSILDRTKTSMGGRLLRHWIKQPLISCQGIHQRQNAIDALLIHPHLLEQIAHCLGSIRDIERLIMKVSSHHASPRDIMALGISFASIPQLKNIVSQAVCPFLKDIARSISPLPEMTSLIASALVDEPPARLSDGRVFRQGFHQELDDLHNISKDSKGWIANYQAELREGLGIKTLKVGFNRMFGYYIEVSRGQAERMPNSFTRKQTLVNAERYITPELKEYETKVLTAEERIGAIESALFAELKAKILTYTSEVIQTAKLIAKLDCLYSLAEIAKERSYIRPLVDEGKQIEIIEGRHPVIEAYYLGENFIPNDTLLDDQDNLMMILTGPNMAGKSTFIRQVALLVIMAQIGSFIPAKNALIGIVDKLFTRIGASDDLSRGQSTFMVEMTETANILNHATDHSLVILDEIGRGTSTYDGISIAWAVAEYLLTAENKKAKTLFATHYWELTKLEKMKGVVNYHVAVQECEDRIIFLRKILRGSTDKSYGVHVARLAGLPSWVIMRAREMLAYLEEGASRTKAFEDKLRKAPPPKIKHSSKDVQLLLFDL